jgi:hypothetical protein
MSSVLHSVHLVRAHLVCVCTCRVSRQDADMSGQPVDTVMGRQLHACPLQTRVGRHPRSQQQHQRLVSSSSDRAAAVCEREQCVSISSDKSSSV